MKFAGVMLCQEPPAGLCQRAKQHVPQVIDKTQLKPLAMSLPQQLDGGLQGNQADEEAQH